MKPIALLIALVTLCGCHAIVPYDSEFMCEKNHDFGKCMSMSDAYKEALAGPVPKDSEGHTDAWDYKDGKRVRAKTKKGKVKRDDDEAQMHLTALSGRDIYKENEYREMAALIEAPATPIVQAPKVLRTLVVSYPAGNTLYMPRYIVYIAEDARFVVGDYLNESKPQVATVFPNGTR